MREAGGGFQELDVTGEGDLDFSVSGDFACVAGRNVGVAMFFGQVHVWVANGEDKMACYVFLEHQVDPSVGGVDEGKVELGIGLKYEITVQVGVACIFEGEGVSLGILSDQLIPWLFQ